ncbi:MAG: adenylyl-sulfate kinase [Deltaproteobacteria bacterium]|nr:adenylyl-sulfate kinase [Deltaproteobacteria bacterium]
MTRTSSSDVVWHHATVTRQRREALNCHQGAVLWLTGLSGSGKSTIAHALEEALFARGCRTYVLDGDNIRHGLCGDLGFSREDRQENIRRIAEASQLFVDAGLIVMTAFISPFRQDRERARRLLTNSNFIEIHCACSSEVCEERDVKGLYRKARQGLIPEFTGISSPYEAPEDPELTLDTATQSIEESVAQILKFLVVRGIVPAVTPA